LRKAKPVTPKFSPKYVRPLLVHVNKRVLVVEVLFLDHSVLLALDDGIPEDDLVLGLIK
jgi:hypothetical protein